MKKKKKKNIHQQNQDLKKKHKLELKRINDDIKTIYNKEKCIKDLVYLMKYKKNNLCIGRTFAFYEEIKKQLIIRRNKKDLVRKRTGKTLGRAFYGIKTKRFLDFLNQNSIKINAENITIVEIKESNCNSEQYRQDILHFIEFSNRFNMRIAFKLMNELINIDDKDLFCYLGINMNNKLF